ncbi:TPA: hypothetical protein ACXIJH_001298 [Serratia marcescens]
MLDFNVDTGKLAVFSKRLSPASESEFIEQLYVDIDSVIKKMEESSDKYYSDDEDKLSHSIVTSLGNLGYEATEQTKKNGTVDITVISENKKYKWIAEAKIGYGNTKILEGVYQLVSRYVKRDEHAGLIIYYQKSGSASCFDKWLKFLYNQEWLEYSQNQGNDKETTAMLGHLDMANYTPTKQSYSDVVIKKPSDAMITVRNFYADFYHNPIDKSGVKNKSLKKGVAKNNIRQYCQDWVDGTFPISQVDQLFTELKLFLGESFDPDDE